MTAAEQKARKLIKAETTANLIAEFELTETMDLPDIYIVRGWLMDELESRDSKAFETWIDSNEASPRKFYN